MALQADSQPAMHNFLLIAMYDNYNLSSIHTTRVHRPCSRAVNTGIKLSVYRTLSCEPQNETLMWR